jgi:hypothetical protein
MCTYTSTYTHTFLSKASSFSFSEEPVPVPELRFMNNFKNYLKKKKKPQTWN